MYDYLLIGSIVGSIFAGAMTFLAKVDVLFIPEMKAKFGDHAATVLTLAVAANVLAWPAVIIFLITRIWKKLV